MKVLQTIAGFGALYGGIATCTYDLIIAMHNLGFPLDLLTLGVRNPNDVLMGKGEEWIKALPNDAKTPYEYSKSISFYLRNKEYDLYHTNGLWMYCNHITCSVARQRHKPYIITPHGMLYPAALKRSYWKKWPLMQLCFRKDINNADCLHVTCRAEMEHVRQFGYSGAIAVIPNPANLPAYLKEIAVDKPSFLECGNRKFGFLGRLHPIKKVENLLYAIDLLKNSQDCELVIMGKGDDIYEQFLRSETKRLGLDKCVKFHGFVNGRDKFEQLAQLSCLFVPSDFENFGMIVTEALSVGTPVMASLGTPWEELNTSGCGWWIDRTPENIAQVMQQVKEMPFQELLVMGERGQQLVQKKYTAPMVATQMQLLYEWLLGKRSKPDFVYE